MDQALKERKEAFVSNLQGSTTSDVCLSTLVVPVCNCFKFSVVEFPLTGIICLQIALLYFFVIFTVM